MYQIANKIIGLAFVLLMIAACKEEVLESEVVATGQAASSTKLVFQDGFESGCWRAYRHKRATGGSCDRGPMWNNSQMQTNSAGKAVGQVGEGNYTAPPREGKHSMRFTWFRSSFGPDDPNNRSKAHLWTGLENKRNTTRWYGFSMYLPSGAGGMEADREGEILVQWHGFPDIQAGEPYRIPTAAILHLGDRLVFKYYYDNNRISTAQSIKFGGQIELGKANLNRWIDFIIRVRWSPEGNGYLEINRKDQVQGATWKRLFKKTSGVPIGYNDQSDPNVGIGIYKYDAAKRHREGKPLSDYYRRQVFFDSFRIGNEYATPDDVKPRGNAW